MYEKNKTIRNGRLPCVRATLSTVMMILMYCSYFPTISIDLYSASILKHFFLSPNLCQCPSKDFSIPLPFSCPNGSSPTRTHLTVVIVYIYIYERKRVQQLYSQNELIKTWNTDLQPCRFTHKQNWQVHTQKTLMYSTTAAITVDVS